jgi:hypothetical protein
VFLLHSKRISLAGIRRVNDISMSFGVTNCEAVNRCTQLSILELAFLGEYCCLGILLVSVPKPGLVQARDSFYKCSF